jgi:hypothetical protein
MSHSASGWYFLHWQYTYVYDICIIPSSNDHICNENRQGCSMSRTENSISNKWYGRSPSGKKLSDEGKRLWFQKKAYPRVQALLQSEIGNRNRENKKKRETDSRVRLGSWLAYDKDNFNSKQLSKFTQEPGDAKCIDDCKCSPDLLLSRSLNDRLEPT